MENVILHRPSRTKKLSFTLMFTSDLRNELNARALSDSV